MRIQSTIIRDELEFENEAGEIVKTLPVIIDMPAAADRILHARAKLAAVRAEDGIEQIGEAFCVLLEAVFGAELFAELKAYYKDAYSAMIADFTPFLMERVYPALDRLKIAAAVTQKMQKNG